MTNSKITKKQEQVLIAIKNLTKNGESPTLKEIQEFLNYSTTSSVQRHTEALKKKGYLTSDKYQTRNLRIKEKVDKLASIPLVGSVACGSPILAIENIEAYIPYEIKGDPADYFFLKAEGDSMNKTGINNNDLVLVKKQDYGENGDKVVALIGDEATIKIYRKDNNKIILNPKSTNPIHKPIYFFEDIQIQGKVVDIIKV